MQRLKAGEVNLGTSIMAVQFKDGVIIGADSRTTTGSYIVCYILYSDQLPDLTLQIGQSCNR